MKKFWMALCLGLVSVFMVGCEDEPDTPAEALGDAIEDAGDELGDAAEEVAEEVEDAAEEVE